MDPRYPPEAEAFRERVRTFLAEHLPADWQGVGALDRDEAVAFIDAWRVTLHRNGFLGVQWPREYGGAGLSKVEQVVLVEELARAGVPSSGPNDTFSIKMAGNTLIRWGTEEQKQRFLPGILSGEIRFCQGYSEPDAGSDLASLSTTAVVDGDELVLNGSKIWQTRAVEANWAFVLARTDPAAAKHHGLSLVFVPMDQPGVEVVPIRQLNGVYEFNQLFFTDARTSVGNVIGAVNDGWNVALSLLGLERGDEAATNPVMFRDEFDRLLALARARGATADPVLRDRLARAYARVETMRFIGLRILTGVLTTGTIGPEASISKLYWSEYHQEVATLAMAVLGADGLALEGRLPLRSYRTDDPGAPNSSGTWIGALYASSADTIYAGTSEIQRNILAENVLGLPRGPR